MTEKETNLEEASLSMKLLVDTESNSVLFAEVNKDCVDFLFKLLSLPLATVTGLLSEHGLFGSLKNLYESIQNLGDEYIQPGQSKKAILEPIVLTSATPLPILLIKGSPPGKTIYGCGNCSRNNSYVSDDPSAICPSCGQKMTTPKTYVAPPNQQASTTGDGFVKGVVTYMVTDGLMVEPLSTIGSITLLNKLNVQKLSTLQSRVVKLTSNEALMLLKASLYTEKVLTEVFVKGQPDE